MSIKPVTTLQPAPPTAPAQAAAPTTMKQPEQQRKPAAPQRAPSLQRAAGALPPPNGSPSAMRDASMLSVPAEEPGSPGRAQMMTRMQQSVGNARVSRMLGVPVQAKLTVNASGDVYEQEADRVADAVMRMVEPTDPAGKPGCGQCPTFIQRTCACGGGCAGCALGKPALIQKQATPGHTPEVTPEAERHITTTKGGGAPLSVSTRAFAEPRFGQDFGGVRVHADAQSNQVARALSAQAFTSGQDIYFGTGHYQPGTPQGDRLLAHELTHVMQQSNVPSQPLSHVLRGAGARTSNRLAKISKSTMRLARQTRSEPARNNRYVSHVTVYLGEANYIDFHTDRGVFRYHLYEQEGLEPGEYEARVTTKGVNVNFDLITSTGTKANARFKYKIEPPKPNPSTFFIGQSSVLFTITEEQIPAVNAGEQEDTRDPNVKYLTLEEALKRCESGDLPGVKVFPFRGTRFGGAPIMAHRDGDDVVVKQPVYVLGNDDFKAQTRTLPKETFIGGVRLKPNEIVRVHTYEPRWYHLNITGSTSGDKEEEFCATGMHMLEIAERSTRRTVMNIGLTVVDAVFIVLPVGRLAAMIGRPILQAAGRASRNLAIAVMLGLRDASPTALAGIASRSSMVVIEQQAVDQVASRAISQTVSYATVEFSEQALAQAGSRVVGEVTKVAGEQASTQLMSHTVTVTVVDAAGQKLISTITTPTGDKAIDEMIDQAFDATFTASSPQAVGQAAQQGVTAVAPEIAAGFTQQQVSAFARILGKRFSQQEIQVMEDLWQSVARPGDKAILNAGNSRYLFDLHRNRFWTAVRNSPEARALFEDAGCKFEGGAPFFMFNGRRVTITVDHIIERQANPSLALTASNLRLAFPRENSVVLRLLHQLDPFQHH